MLCLMRAAAIRLLLSVGLLYTVPRFLACLLKIQSLIQGLLIQNAPKRKQKPHRADKYLLYEAI